MARRNSPVLVEAEDRFAPPNEAEMRRHREEGTSFGWFDRLFMGWDEGKVFQYSDWEARDIEDMLKRDYKARQIEAVLTYPALRAARSIEDVDGNTEAGDFVRNFFALDHEAGGMSTPLDLVLDQMVSSAIFKKAYWEPKWKMGTDDFEGKIVYRKFAWRPQTVTRSLHDGQSGKLLGWRQDPWSVGPLSKIRTDPPEGLLSKNQALIHIHGARRDPINGVSDLEVPYWAYQTKQKVIFLMLQFLEGVSLPRVVVKANDGEVAQSVARQIAGAKNTGIIPVNVDGRPDSVAIDVLNLAGNGADQFMRMISWLDQSSVDSVMAGFLSLPGAAANGRGSNALSEDASDFFLMSLESKNREYERTTRTGIFAPLVRYNLGPKARAPRFRMEPLNAEDKGAMVSMLEALMHSRDPALVPDEFIGALVNKVADYFGMNGKEISKAFQGAAERARQLAAQSAVVAGQTVPGVNAVQQRVARNAAGNVAAVAGAVGAATRAVKAGKAGKDPVKAAKGKA